MAATVQIVEKNGAGGTQTDKTSGSIRFKNADNSTVDLVNPMVKDVVITREEIEGLMRGLLDSDAPAAGNTKLTDWAVEHRDRQPCEGCDACAQARGEVEFARHCCGRDGGNLSLGAGIRRNELNDLLANERRVDIAHQQKSGMLTDEIHAGRHERQGTGARRRPTRGGTADRQ